MAVKRNPVGWVEIPVVNMARAKKFYEHVFSTKLEEYEMESVKMAQFPMRDGIYGAAGALVKGTGYKPCSGGPLIYFSVSDVNATLKRAKAKGGRTITPKTSIGDWGFYGVFKDSEGNQIGIHS